MKIAVSGKGGVGKTTISGTLARTLARAGHTVTAIDADVNPMLGITLGLGVDDTERIIGVRQALSESGLKDAVHEFKVDGLLDRYGEDAPDGVRVLVASRVDLPDHGCLCCGVSADRLMREIGGDGRTVLSDLEAGVGVMARMEPGSLDLALVVANPTPKSIEVARRAAEAAAERGIRVLVLANRVQTEEDLEEIRAALGEHEIAVIPEDPAITQADAEGLAPIDLDDSSPGVRAIAELADRLVGATRSPTGPTIHRDDRDDVSRMTGTAIHVRVPAMSNSELAYGKVPPVTSAQFAVGDRVIRRDDGKVGVVATLGTGSVPAYGVRWEPSGVIQMIVPGLIKKA